MTHELPAGCSSPCGEEATDDTNPKAREDGERRVLDLSTFAQKAGNRKQELKTSTSESHMLPDGMFAEPEVRRTLRFLPFGMPRKSKSAAKDAKTAKIVEFLKK